MNATIDATTPQRHFEVALQSPAMVGAKDRNGWVGLFHPEGFVEDPVEAGRYAGTANIETFWDVFIGPQPSVHFDVARDYWGGDLLIRQATVVNVTEADETETLRVPALIQYTLREGRVGALQAVWEPPKVIAWFVRHGFAGMTALSKHSMRMLGKAGLRNGLSFGGTMVGGLGKDRARTLVEAIRMGDRREWAHRAANASVTVASPKGSVRFESDAQAALTEVQRVCGSISALAVDQLLVCGNHVAAFLAQPGGTGALALMLRATGHGDVVEMNAIWSPTPHRPRAPDVEPLIQFIS